MSIVAHSHPFVVGVDTHARNHVYAVLAARTFTKMAHDPETRKYVEKRQAEGRTTKEIRQCIKRYLARHVHRTLNSSCTANTP
ncbi:MAG: family transposase [Pseudarthrobacter sp.]|nr:family transposase [Pseudarthrobacter sp.]